MTDMRSINLSGEEAGKGYYMLTGFINASTRVLSGTISFIPVDGVAVVVSVTGASSGDNPEELTILTQQADKLNINGTAEIQTDGTITANLTGTLPDGSDAAVLMNGTVSQFPVIYTTPQPSEVGLEVLNGVTINEPCALADQLRAAKLKLISGNQESRIEFGGRTLYFHRGNLTELNKAIEKYDAQCVATGGTNSELNQPTVRSRRPITVKSYY